MNQNPDRPEIHKNMSRYGLSFRHTPVAPQGVTGMYKNDTGQPIYADKDGKLVDESDPNAAYLVVASNATLSAKDASRYGLTNEEKPAAEEAPAAEPAKAIEEAPADKAVDKAPANKAVTNKQTK